MKVSDLLEGNGSQGLSDAEQRLVADWIDSNLDRYHSGDGENPEFYLAKDDFLTEHPDFKGSADDVEEFMQQWFDES